MAKDKKGFGIKTTRYFTKNCSACGFEYPNWFTNCPKCGAAWDELRAKAFQPSSETHKKTIKIVVKITEEDFNRKILSVNLIFSANQGKSWYQMQMTSKVDYFIAEIAEVPAGSNIIYYIEVYLENGEVIIENNNNKYYYYKVGVSLGEPEEIPSEVERNSIKNSIKEADIIPQQYVADSPPLKKVPHISRKAPNPPPKIPQTRVQPNKQKDAFQNTSSKGLTIFGKPQTNIDPDLKICSFCKSKIKKMWSTCPICGENL